jgi:iron complex outermembrane receptor protein
VRPEYSSAHPGVTGPFPAICAIDALYNGTTLDVLDGLTGTGGTQDIWAVTEALDAQFGYTPGAKTTGGVSFTPVECAQNNIPGCSTVARGLNNVAEYGFDEERQHQSDVFLVDMNWDVGDHTLSMTASNVQYDKHDWLDPDAGTVAIFTDERVETFDQTALEFRVASPADQRFSWMAGAYYQNSDLDTTIDVFLPRVLGPNPGGAIAVSFGGDLVEEATWTSVFFMGTFSITDAFRLNFGGRRQDIQKDGVLSPTRAYLYPGMTTYYPNGRVREPNGPPVPANADANDTLPEFGVEWDVGESSMLYAKYAEALKAGGFVMSPAIGRRLPDPPTYRPEFAKGVEFGYKTLTANDSLELNLAVYDVDFTDLQVSIFLSEEGRFTTGNAAEAHTTGIEFDGRWAATDNFTLSFGGAINEAEYDKYDGADCNSLDVKLRGQPCFNDLAGVSLPLSPDWTMTLSPEFRFNIGDYRARFGANLMYNDGYDLGNDFDPIDLVPSHHRLDIRLALTPPSGSWEIALHGHDVTDERAIIGGTGDFQNKSLDLIYDAGGVARERGARWGLQGSYFFGD